MFLTHPLPYQAQAALHKVPLMGLHFLRKKQWILLGSRRVWRTRTSDSELPSPVLGTLGQASRRWLKMSGLRFWHSWPRAFHHQKPASSFCANLQCTIPPQHSWGEVWLMSSGTEPLLGANQVEQASKAPLANPQTVKEKTPAEIWGGFFQTGFLVNIRKRAEYCFGGENSLSSAANVLSSRWVRLCIQIIGWEELTECSPRNSVRAKNNHWAQRLKPCSPKLYSARLRILEGFLAVLGGVFYFMENQTRSKESPKNPQQNSKQHLGVFSMPIWTLQRSGLDRQSGSVTFLRYLWDVFSPTSLSWAANSPP